MKIGLVGLGRMGVNMARQLVERFSFRRRDRFSRCTVAVLRSRFGGHTTKGA